MDLSENRITKLPQDVGKLNKLLYLRLSGNELSETDFPSLVDITPFSSIEGFSGYRLGLYLNDNNFTLIPPSIFELKGLQVLQIDGNPLFSIPSEIKEMKSLKILMVSQDPSIQPTKSTGTKNQNEIPELNLPELERLYTSPPSNFLDNIPVLPSLIDTDIPSSEYLSPLGRQAYSVPSGPSTRKVAFSQMLGSNL